MLGVGTVPKSVQERSRESWWEVERKYLCFASCIAGSYVTYVDGYHRTSRTPCFDSVELEPVCRQGSVYESTKDRLSLKPSPILFPFAKMLAKPAIPPWDICTHKKCAQGRTDSCSSRKWGSLSLKTLHLSVCCFWTGPNWWNMLDIDGHCTLLTVWLFMLLIPTPRFWPKNSDGITPQMT